MSEFEELREKAEDLRKTKKYRLAIPTYKHMWDNYPNDCTKWDGWGYATCLLKEKKYDEAYVVCHKVYEMDPNFVFNNGLYAWSIYKREMLKERVNNPEHFFSLAYLITSITTQSETQSPYTKTVFRVLDYLDRQPVYPTDAILEWLGKVDHKKLPMDAEIYTNRNGKKVLPASFYEQYFTYKAKALYKKEKYQESIDLCKEAFEVIRVFHNNNDIWLLRRVALANARLGKTDLALEQLHDILEENNRWFVMKDIADIYITLDKLDEAKQIAVEGALLPGETSKKTKLFNLLAHIYRLDGMHDVAAMIVKLLIAINQKKFVPHDETLLDLAKEYTINPDEQIDVQDALNECRAYWQKESNKYKDPYHGRIDRIQKDTGLGYIKAGTGKGFILPFKLKEFLGGDVMVPKGTMVAYYVADIFEAKKNRYLRYAVDVSVVPEPPPEEKKEGEATETERPEPMQAAQSEQEQW